MCGIAGAIDLRGMREFPPERLEAMCAAIEHRGPDDQKMHTEAGVALGARRLSIVDLAGGRQPLSNEDGSVWVAFNGELFEYPELMEQLQSHGHKFSSRCDTEIWVHLYEERGEEMFEKTKGQYAVSLWDRRNRTLILGRDRVGICPLFYAEADGWLLWASEIKALLASGLIQASPDPKGVDHFFCFITSGTTRTFFEGVKSLPPGHFLRVCDGHVRLHKYWDHSFPDMGDEWNPKDARAPIDELERLLRQSVRRRLRGDVPVVSYLSGGVDSATILAMASQELNRPVPSFTIGLNNAGVDESDKASRAAAFIGSPLTTLRMDSNQIAEGYPELIRAAEGPVLDTSCACMIALARQVHDSGFKVALTGEGADEALAGYEWFKYHKVQSVLDWRLGRMAYRFRDGRLRIGSPNGHIVRAPFEAIHGVRTVQQLLYERFGSSRESLYSPQMWSSLANHSPFDDLDLNHERFAHWHPLNQALYVDFRVFLPGLLLSSKGDRSAMNSSVETRPPFLDEDVLDFCARIHPRYKLRGLTSGKWLLRQVAARMLPREIARRPKYGFKSKLSETFLGAHRPHWVDHLLSPESLRATGFFDPDEVARQRTLQKQRRRLSRNRVTFDLGLTSVVATQLWYHTFCGGNLADLPAWSPPAIKSRRDLSLSR